MKKKLLKRLLSWYRRRLESQISTDFDPALSRKLDAVAVLTQE